MAGPRYLRYIVFAVVCIGVIFFISSSSSSTSSQITSASDKLKETLKGQVPKVQVPDANDIKESLKDKVAKVQVPDTNDVKNAIVGTGSDTTPQLPQGQVPSRPNAPKKQQDQDAPPRGQEPLPNSGGDSRPAKKPSADTSTSTPPTSANNQGKLGPAKVPGPRMNATFVTLARNSDLWEIVKSIRQVEDRFNRKFNYDWVFLNEKPFDDEFIRVTSSLVSGQTKYGLIAEEHWSFPEWIDQDKAAAVRKDMADRQIIYGDSISYRHMCRFESGFFFRQPLMLEYEWYWRVEPSIELYCDVDYDAFRFMADNGKKYSFVISLFEYKETIPTLWDSTKKFIAQHPEHIAKDNSMGFISDDKGKTYNHCHFWSNFEIGNLNWLRSEAYIDYFTSLDRDGGFFYERWGDAPVHSIAAALLLPKDQIHFFNDIAYYHVPFTHCPSQEQLRIDNKCHCKPSENFDWNGYSCTNKFYDLHGMKKPDEANQ